MNPRDELVDLARTAGMPKARAERFADEALAAHAHELAEEQRTYAEEEWGGGDARMILRRRVARHLADLIDPSTGPSRPDEEPGPDGDPETICGASHRPDPTSTSPRLVARCTCGQGHAGAHSGHDFDGRGPYQWPGKEPTA